MNEERIRQSACVMATMAIKTCADIARGDSIRQGQLLQEMAQAMHTAADQLAVEAIKTIVNRELRYDRRDR